MKKNQVLKYASSHMEALRQYKTLKNDNITLIKVNKDNIELIGSNETLTFNFKEYLNYLKSEVIPNLNSIEFMQFMEILGGL